MQTYTETATDIQTSQGHRMPATDARTACVAIIWVNGELDEQHQEDIIMTLSRGSGIESARFSPSRAHLVIVRYHQHQTSGRHILSVIRNSGYQALLVGC